MDSNLLINLIWAGTMGLAAGSYTTSYIFRTPRGESPFTKHPYCGGCGTMLKARDLFPFFSWLFLRGRCRYCGMEIPAVYFCVEAIGALVFLLAVIAYGFSEVFVLITTAAMVGATLWGLEVRTSKIYTMPLLCMAALGLTYRTLLDGTIYDSLFGAFYGAGIPIILWQMRMKPEERTGEKQRVTPPSTMSLGAVAGLWFAPFGLLVFCGLWGGAQLIYRVLAPKLNSHFTGKALVPAYLFVFLLLLLEPNIIPYLKILSIQEGRVLLDIHPK